MIPDNVSNRLRKLIATELSVEPDAIQESTVMGRDIKCDSLDYISLISKIEQEFGVDFSPKEVSGASETFSKLVQLIESKLTASDD